MKKVTQIICSIVILLTVGIFNSFAADSTGAPQGVARQPDIDQQGADIVGVDEIEAATVRAAGAEVTGTVSAGAVSTPAAAITELNTGRAQIQNPPIQPKDGTNKEYVDGQVGALNNRVAALESGGGSGVNAEAATHSGEWVDYARIPCGPVIPLNTKCKPGYTLIVSFVPNQKYMGVTQNCSTNSYYIFPATCIKNDAVLPGHTTMILGASGPPNFDR